MFATPGRISMSTEVYCNGRLPGTYLISQWLGRNGDVRCMHELERKF
jgi:hypothetical protein